MVRYFTLRGIGTLAHVRLFGYTATMTGRAEYQMGELELARKQASHFSDVLVSLWHERDWDGESLQSFMCLSDDEYAAWARGATLGYIP
jgi:hypothetical protein